MTTTYSEHDPIPYVLTAKAHEALGPTTAQRLQGLIADGVRVFAEPYDGGIRVTLARGPLCVTRWHTTQENATAYALDAWDQGWFDDIETAGDAAPAYSVVIVRADGAVLQHEMPRDAAYAIVLDELRTPTEGTESVSIRPVSAA